MMMADWSLFIQTAQVNCITRVYVNVVMKLNLLVITLTFDANKKLQPTAKNAFGSGASFLNEHLRNLNSLKISLFALIQIIINRPLQILHMTP